MPSFKIFLTMAQVKEYLPFMPFALRYSNHTTILNLSAIVDILHVSYSCIQ